MARTDYYGIQTPVLQATSQAIRQVNGTVGTIAPEDYPDLISAMKSGTDYDNVMAQLVEETVSGSIVTFTDGANNIPCKNLEVNVTATQDLHGQSAPYPSGGQLWDEEWENGFINASGNNAGDSSSIRSKNYSPCTPETNYYVKSFTTPTMYVVFYDSEKTFISRAQGNDAVITSPSNAYFFRVSCYGYGTTYKYNISINYPSTDTSYHPYSNICPIHGWDSVKIVNTPILPYKTEDKAPYLFRPSASGSDRDRENDTLVGASYPFNQLAKGNVSTSTMNDITFTNNGDGSYTVNGTATGVAYLNVAPFSEHISNHKYLIWDNYSGNDWGFDDSLQINKRKKILTNIGNCIIHVPTGVTVNNFKIFPQLFDLTKMFGSTIADYIYSLEQGTAGAGVAWFRNLFPKDYYAYNAGELMSVKTSKHITVGFNQWDEEWELGGINATTGQNTTSTTTIRSKNYIRVVPNTTYYVKTPAIIRFRWYDADKNCIGNQQVSSSNTFTIPSGCYYARFVVIDTTTYANNICINLSDASKNGEYEPYVKHEYDYSGEREVTRYFGVVDLGSLNYTMTQTEQKTYFTTTISGMKPCSTTSEKLPAVCPLYIATTQRATWVDKDMAYYNVGYANVSFVNNAYSDAQTFKTAMSGVYLVYELATPYTETVSNPELRGIPKLDANNKLYYYGDTCSDLPNPQAVDDFGTEEYVDNREVAIPVGHNTEYFNSKSYEVVVQLGDTYYGGQLEIDDDGHRRFKVTHTIVDLGTLNWSYNSGALRFDGPGANILHNKNIPGSEIPNAKCSIYKAVKYNNNYPSSGPDNVFFFDTTLLRVRNKAYTDATTFKNAMSGVMLVYELATPYYIDLTDGEPITTLLGNNTFFADTGDISVTYRANGGLYVAQH